MIPLKHNRSAQILSRTALAMAAQVKGFDNGQPTTVSTISSGEASATFATSSRPGMRQIALAGALALVLVVAGILFTPIAARPLLPIPGFMTAFGSGMLVINLVLASLLFSKGSIEKRPDAVRLGACYFFVALIFVPLLLSFKDGLVPGTVIGTPVSSVWLWSCWHAGFAIMIGFYAVNIGRARAAPSILTVIVTLVGVVLVLAVVATVGLPYLPPVFINGQTLFTGPALAIPICLLFLNGIALLLCLWLRARTTEQLWVTVAMIAACFDVWLTVYGTNRFSLGWYVAKCGSLVTSMAVIVSLFHEITKLYRNAAESNLLLETLAHKDSLTSTYNRRHFDATLKTEWSRSRRESHPLSVLMVDVDLFKQFNDKLGHLAGDECLRTVGRCLTEGIHRPADVLTRFGGEEFAILLPNTDREGSLTVGEMLRRSIEALRIPHPLSPGGFLSVSIGSSTLIPDSSSDPLLLVRLADEALYRAKSEGRNCTVAAELQNELATQLVM